MLNRNLLLNLKTLEINISFKVQYYAMHKKDVRNYFTFLFTHLLNKYLSTLMKLLQTVLVFFFLRGNFPCGSTVLQCVFNFASIFQCRFFRGFWSYSVDRTGSTPL